MPTSFTKVYTKGVISAIVIQHPCFSFIPNPDKPEPKLELGQKAFTEGCKSKLTSFISPAFSTFSMSTQLDPGDIRTICACNLDNSKKYYQLLTP